MLQTLPFKQGGKLLEIGEANLYGDFEPGFVEQDPFKAAKLLYKELFEPSKIISIDMDGPTALKYDLNKPFTLDEKFDVVINHGTAEHIFNVANVFRVIHNSCAVGGLMIHEAPFTGWIDHGFYNLQPTLFWDIAAVNAYEIVLFAAEHLKTQLWTRFKRREDILQNAQQMPNNLMLFVCFRKRIDREFRPPMQGVYNNTVSQEVQDAWQNLR